MTIQPSAPPVTARPPVGRADVPANRRRGGDLRVLLSPTTCGATAGFLGTLTLEPGELVTEHWHPYSEEFLYCVTGSVTVVLDGTPVTLGAEQAVHVPLGVRHRIVNDGPGPATFVFVCGPLAPRPELGHVDTEPVAHPAAQPVAHPAVQSAVQPAVQPVGAAT